MSNADATHYSCFLCSRRVQMGPHRYEGRVVQAWGKMLICDGCRTMNHDGIVPETHPHLVPHLQSLGLTVRPNAKGWIVIPD